MKRPLHITVPSACARIGGDKPINRSTYYRGVKAGIYPAPFHISPNIARVDAEQLDEAIEARKSGAASGAVMLDGTRRVVPGDVRQRLAVGFDEGIK